MSFRETADGRLERGLTTSIPHWTVAALFVLAAHIGGLWAVLNWKPTPASEGEAPPAVMIELAPLAVVPEAPLPDLAPGPQTAEAQPEPAPDTPLEKPDEKPEQVAQQVEKAVENPTPTQIPLPIDTPKLPEKLNAEAVLPKSASTPAQPKKKRPKVRELQRKKPIYQETRRVEQATAPPPVNARHAEAAAAPFSSSALAPSTSPATWRGQLMAHLNRFKRFPSGASAGVASIVFVIDRAGRVISARLVGSSGDSALDMEAVSLPRRASPVPTPPADVGGVTITLTVPIRFNR